MLLTLILHNNTGAVDAINNENLACTYNNISSFSTTEFDELLLYKHWINGWLTVLVIVGGIFANCVTMFALVHGHMLRTPTNIYLMALSFSNLISLICLLVMSGLRFILVHPYRLIYCKNWYESFVSLAIPYLTPINQSFQLSGIYIITAASIDRYFFVRSQKRLARDHKRSTTFTRLVIALIYLFSFLLTIPNWFAFTSQPVWSNLTEIVPTANQEEQAYKVRHYTITHTELGQNHLFKMILNVWLYIPFAFGIPLIILIKINVLILWELAKIKDRKRQLGISRRIDRNITLMLVSIVVLFLVCQVPPLISQVIYAMKPQVMFERYFFLYNSFTSFLTCIYMSVNFSLFCFFGQAFRYTLHFIFCMKPAFKRHTFRASRFQRFEPQILKFSRGNLKRNSIIALKTFQRDKKFSELSSSRQDNLNAEGLGDTGSAGNSKRKWSLINQIN